MVRLEFKLDLLSLHRENAFPSDVSPPCLWFTCLLWEDFTRYPSPGVSNLQDSDWSVAC